MKKVFLLGNHSKRTPTAYRPYQSLLSDSFEFDCTLAKSDIVILGHIRDLYNVVRETAAILQSKNIILLSEEPLWDVQSGGVFLDKFYEVQLYGFDIRIEIYNFANSDIFEYIHYPYFLTTDDRYFFHYAYMFLDSYKLPLLNIWENTKYQYLYIGEKRPEKAVHLTFSDRLESGLRVQGLSDIRASIPTNLPKNKCLLIGKGWSPTEQTERQSLLDWHLEKLVLYKGQSLFISALENTLCPNYVTEKLFDAYAMQGIPVYCNQSGLVKNSLLSDSIFNIRNVKLKMIASHIVDFKPDHAFIEKYTEARHCLTRMFSNYADYVDERARFSTNVRNILLKYCH